MFRLSILAVALCLFVTWRLSICAPAPKHGVEERDSDQIEERLASVDAYAPEPESSVGVEVRSLKKNK